MGNKTIPQSHYQKWDSFVASIVGGLSALTQGIKGSWRSPRSRKLIQEIMYPVRIACTRKQLTIILRFTSKHYQQKTVMAYEVSPEVVFYESILGSVRIKE